MRGPRPAYLYIKCPICGLSGASFCGGEMPHRFGTHLNTHSGPLVLEYIWSTWTNIGFSNSHPHGTKLIQYGYSSVLQPIHRDLSQYPMIRSAFLYVSFLVFYFYFFKMAVVRLRMLYGLYTRTLVRFISIHGKTSDSMCELKVRFHTLQPDVS